MQTQQHEEQTTNPTPLVLDTAPDVKLDSPSTIDTNTQAQAEEKKTWLSWQRLIILLGDLFSKIDYFVLSQLHGTKEFNQRYSLEINSIFERHITKFQLISNMSLSEEYKARLLPHIKKQELQLAIAKVWWDRLVKRNTIAFPICVVFVLLQKYVNRISTMYSFPHRYVPMWIGVLGFLFVVFNLYILVKIMFYSSKSPQFYRYKIFFGCDTFLASLYMLTYLSVVHGGQQTSLSVLQTATIRGSVLGVQFFVSAMLGSVSLICLAFAFLRWRNSKYPDAVIIHKLTQVLHDLDLKPEKWTDITFKRRLISDIEEAALCVQNYLPRRLASRNLEMLTWQKQTFGEIAATIRATTQWVSTPKPDTRERLIERLRLFLECAVTGEWDTFTGEQWKAERAQSEALIRPVTLSERLWAGCRVLVLATLPSFGVYLFHMMRPHIELPSLAIVGAVAWPIAIVLAAVDPDFKSKVATFKDAASLLPLSGKDKR